MFDNYIYKVVKDGNFFAGYTVCTISGGNTHPVFLFTSLRIIRVLSGCAQWKIGSKIHTVQNGDIIVVNNFEPRQFMNIFRAPFECEIFAFSPGIFRNESSCLALFYNHSDNFDPVINKSISDIDEIYTLLDILKVKFQNSSHNAQYSPIVISSLISAISAHILDCMNQNCSDMLCKSDHPKSYSAKIVAQSIEYINKNISDELNVSVLAKNANLSRGYFNKVFLRYTGNTPANFINRCRINNALHLISTEEINILDAAMASGFKTSSGFYKTFHSICGMSPKGFLTSIVDKPLL